MDLLSYVLVSDEEGMWKFLEERILTKPNYQVLFDYTVKNISNLKNGDGDTYYLGSFLEKIIFSKFFTEKEYLILREYLEEISPGIFFMNEAFEPNPKISLSKIFYKNLFSESFREGIKRAIKKRIEESFLGVNYLEEEIGLIKGDIIDLMKRTPLSGGALAWVIGRELCGSSGTGMKDLDFFCEDKEGVYNLINKIINLTSLKGKIFPELKDNKIKIKRTDGKTFTYEVLNIDGEEESLMISENALTFFSNSKRGIPIQFVFRDFSSIEEEVNNFDFVHTKSFFIYEKEELKLYPETMESLFFGKLIPAEKAEPLSALFRGMYYEKRSSEYGSEMEFSAGRKLELIFLCILIYEKGIPFNVLERIAKQYYSNNENLRDEFLLNLKEKVYDFKKKYGKIIPVKEVLDFCKREN